MMRPDVDLKTKPKLTAWLITSHVWLYCYEIHTDLQHNGDESSTDFHNIYIFEYLYNL